MVIGKASTIKAPFRQKAQNGADVQVIGRSDLNEEMVLFCVKPADASVCCSRIRADL